MAVVRPDAIFVLDELRTMDEYSETGATRTRAIPWKIETNTQGSNRAHDQYARLEQVNITMGNFLGQMRYGIRGHDLHGKPQEISKITKDMRPEDLLSRPLPWDVEDMLRVGKDLREWRLFAESVEHEGEKQVSYGRINLVQYRYVTLSVNVGGAHGSIGTDQYARASSQQHPVTNYPNGVAAPYVDFSR